MLKKNLKRLLILAAILIILIITIAIMAKSKPAIEPIKATPQIWAVNAKTIKITSLSPVYSLLGKVESNNLVNSASPINGVVGAIYVQEGEAFIKGQKLISLAIEDLELPIALAKANVIFSKSQLDIQNQQFSTNKQALKYELSLLKIRQKNVERNQQLTNKNLSSLTILENAKVSLVNQQKAVLITQKLVDEHQNRLKQFNAELNKAKINLQQAQINLERGQLVAPFDGYVTSLPVAIGDRVNAGTVLISYYAHNSLELKTKIPNIHLNAIFNAITNEQQLFASYTSQQQTFHLPLIRFAGKETTSGLDAFLAIPKTLPNIRIGRLMNVTLNGATIDNTFEAPLSALYGADKIFIIDPQTSQLVSRNVQKIGRTSQSKLLLKGDLKTGDLLLTTHLPNAISGLKVTVKP